MRPALTSLNWIEAILLPVATAVLTATWLSLWGGWLVRVLQEAAASASMLTSATLTLLILAGASVTRYVLAHLGEPDPDRPSQRRRLRGDPGPRTRAVIVLAGLVATVAALWLTYGVEFPAGFWRGLTHWKSTIPPEIVNLALSVYAWRRGIVVGRNVLPFSELEQTFYGGVAALAVLLVLNSLRPVIAPEEVLGPVLVFFLAGLSALALASFERFRRQQREAIVAAPALTRYWLLTMANVVGWILVGGLLLAGIVSPGLVGRLLRPITDALFPVVAFGLTLLVLAVFWLLEPLAVALALAILRVSEALRSLLNLNLPQPDQPPDLAAAREAVITFLNSPLGRVTTSSLTLLLMVIAIALVFWLVVRRFARLSRADVDETRESLLSRELLWSQLKSLLQRRAGRTPPAPSPFLGLTGPASDPRRRIRQAYQGLLTWAQAQGQGRAPGQTPTTYSQRLAAAWPDSREAFITLTDGYTHARYGGEAEPPTAEMAQAAEAALNQLQAPAPQRKP